MYYLEQPMERVSDLQTMVAETCVHIIYQIWRQLSVFK